MKTSAIVRIVMWSVLAVFLTGVLCIGITKPDWLPGKFSVGNGISGLKSALDYPESESYTVGEGSVSADQIQEIEIHWSAGKVHICTYDGERVRFWEDDGLAEDDQMRYLVRDGKLTIQYRKPFFLFGFSNTGSLPKELSVEIPESMAAKMDLKTLEVETASAGISAENLRCGEINLTAVSGRIVLEQVACNKADLETVSGEITAVNVEAERLSANMVSGAAALEGSFAEIDTEGVSGACEVRSAVCPESVNMETVSGNVSLSIPENKGFTAEIETVSGDFDCDFATTGRKSRYQYGSGGAEFDFESVSGDIRILKNN